MTAAIKEKKREKCDTEGNTVGGHVKKRAKMGGVQLQDKEHQELPIATIEEEQQQKNKV